MKLSNTLRPALAVVAIGVALSGCQSPPNQSTLRLQPDFGQAVRKDLAAQIADPDGVGSTAPAPKANGNRTALAQDRYQKNQVTPPAASSTSGINSNGSSSGGGPGGGT